MDGPKCIGCSSIIEEGSVIAFGDSLFHLKCFVCAKCSEPVDCESNLLLLSNGRPVCENCSYCCTACKQVICDEAIMTGDEAYHADCFRCVSCKRKIEDLVFTQTSKGIHCTSCHEKRKAHKQKKREKRMQMKQTKELSPTETVTQDKPRPARINTSTDPPTPSRSRSNSADRMRLDRPTPSKSEVLVTKPPSPPSNISPNSPPLSITSSYTNFQSFSSTTSFFDDFSFFDSESTDLVNLTKTLGANIIHDKKKSIITENIARASQLLETSLMIDESDYDSFPQPPTNNSSDELLRAELEVANSKIATMQTSYNKIKEASRQALDELDRAKEEILKEVALRQQQEFVITQLKQQLQLAYRAKSMSRPELAVITREEMERVAKLRAELDRTCNELKHYRNVLVKDIEFLTKQKQTALNPTSHLEEQQKALLCEIKSLQGDREHIIADKKSLESVRDEILHEMIMLNTKHAEITAELNHRQPSLSSELMQRKSSEGAPPKMFKLKKKGNVFSKFSKQPKIDASTIIYGPNSPNTTSSLNISSPIQAPVHQHGTHAFLQTSFIRPTKCDACYEKMWGLSELKCQGCTYTTHFKCLPQVPQACTHSSSGLFGVDLSDRSKYEERPVPLIIEKCIQAVEKRGMDYEGIYRKSGGAAQIRVVVQSFESGELIDLEDDECINDICAVTSVLKQYFRELPNPLIPYELYSQFIDAVSTNQIGQNTIDKFKQLLSQLPRSNYETLKLLMDHLYSVQERHHENLMTTKNLAMVFGPTLLRDIESTRDLIDMSSKNTVVEYLILNVKELLF